LGFFANTAGGSGRRRTWTHATFWTDLTTLSDAQRAETAWWIAWYRTHRDQLGPAVYELTGADPLDGQSWAAWQP
jgi:hypothetical protein